MNYPRNNKKNTTCIMQKTVFLSLLGTLILASCGTDNSSVSSPDTAPITDLTPAPEITEAGITPSPEPTATPVPTAVPTPEAPREMPVQIKEELAPELISAYASGADKDTIVQIIDEMAAIDPASADAWEHVLDYWDQVNKDRFTNIYDGLAEIRDNVIETGITTTAFDDVQLLPDDLPTDDSLCFVVLGFQLNTDGTPRKELIDRLITVTGCLQKYPDAYILLTGGPTAYGDPSATEAGAMADWLMEHGIEKERLIIEDRSLITYDNAVFSYDILREQYPQVQNLVIVSSDYHIPLGCILFEAECLLRNNGGYDPHVIANVGCVTDGRYYFGLQDQAKQMKGLFKD